ncbi:MAG: hypothetical protein GTN49_10670 [candidate division Zixibacteria bacterium]|nr:hypothetical protein [candidate division Zixibacteria bacterium]
MANLIAFWCGGGYFENPPGVPPEPGIELQFSPELYPCSWPYRNFYKDDNFAASMAARVCIMHGIMPSHVYVRRIAGSLNEGFPSFIRRDIKYYHHFPPLTDPDAVDYHRAQDYHDYYEEEHWPTFPTPAGYWNPCDSDNWDYIKSTIALPQVIVVGETEYKFRGWPIWLSTLWGWASQGKWSFAHAYTIYGYYDTGHTVKCKTSWKLKPEQDLSFDNPWHPYKDADVMAGEFVFVKNSSYSIDAAVEYCVVYEENNKKIFDWSLASNAKTWAKKMNVVAVTGQGYKVVVNEKPVKVNFNETAYSLEYNVSSLPKGARYNLEVVLRNGDKLEYPFKEGKQ